MSIREEDNEEEEEEEEDLSHLQILQVDADVHPRLDLYGVGAPLVVRVAQRVVRRRDVALGSVEFPANCNRAAVGTTVGLRCTVLNEVKYIEVGRIC